MTVILVVCCAVSWCSIGLFSVVLVVQSTEHQWIFIYFYSILYLFVKSFVILRPLNLISDFIIVTALLCRHVKHWATTQFSDNSDIKISKAVSINKLSRGITYYDVFFLTGEIGKSYVCSNLPDIRVFIHYVWDCRLGKLAKVVFRILLDSVGPREVVLVSQKSVVSHDIIWISWTLFPGVLFALPPRKSPELCNFYGETSCGYDVFYYSLVIILSYTAISLQSRVTCGYLNWLHE